MRCLSHGYILYPLGIECQWLQVDQWSMEWESVDFGKEIKEPMDKEPTTCKGVAMVLRYPGDREDKDENP